MKAIAAAVRFLVFTNIFIATCVLCFTSKTSLMLYGSTGNPHVNTLAFFATMFFYGFHRLYRRFRLFNDEHKEERHHWVDERKKMYYFLVGATFLITLSQLCYMPVRVLLLLLPVGIIAAGYSVPVIKTSKGFIRIRDISWLKVLWIGISYAWLTTFLPVVYSHPLQDLLNPKVLFIFAENLIFIVVLCIPFDIRDINYDKRNGVNTIPVLLGVKGAIKVCFGLLAIFIAVALLHFCYAGISRYTAVALCASAFEIACFIPLSTPEKPNLFFPLAIESSMIIQFGLLVCAIVLIR